MISNNDLIDRLVEARFESLVQKRNVALLYRAPIRHRVGRVLVHVGTRLEQRADSLTQGKGVPDTDH